METITASITQPRENIEAFADENGYMSKVEDPNDFTKLIDNPEDRITFVMNLFKQHALKLFIASAENRITRAKQDEAKTEIAAHKEALAATITIK